MKRALKFAGVLVGVLLMVVLAFGAKGYLDALSDADELRTKADGLIASGLGGAALGADNLAVLLRVEDPNFANHSGVDFSTPGAGLTTITQSVSKRLAFEEFRPGFGKIRQTGYALGLERRLSKDQILALWLDSLEMGNGPNGRMVGFHAASSTIFGKPPADLNATEFRRLVAVLIAPTSYDLTRADPTLDDRAARIERLIAGTCSPLGLQDVWLDGCKPNAG